MSDQVDQRQPQGAPDSEASRLLERLRAGLADEYDVQQELGEGGMAFVYLAKDIRHDRMVAIKVLKPDLASVIGPERFLREIKSAAKLSHPHILPLYDSGESNGMLYYVMPFVEGESLADYMSREKQLSVEEAVQVAREIAEALSVAHSYGLVHRDIKPDNVMMTGGHAVVADFGIALAIDQAGGDKLTQTGMAIGTPAYMSPEQSQGDPDLDGRADIYSLGCMMYEMLVGQIPFTAPTPVAMIARHAMDHPTPVHIMREAVPPDLENIVFIAMEKTPADRFRTAQEMVDALKAFEQGTASNLRRSSAMQRAASGMWGATPVTQPWWKKAAVPAGVGVVVLVGVFAVQQFTGGSGGLGGATGADSRNVAVLYFDDLSGSGEWAHVADGLTEGLITNLSQVRDLNVVSRNGVAQFRGTDIRHDSIAAALDVGSIVDGSVEEVSGGLKVETRLLDASGSTIDRSNFVIAPEQLLAAQDSVAQAVANLLRQVLGDEVQLRQRRETASNVDAWLSMQRAERFTKDAEDLLDQDEVDQGTALLLRADSALANAEAADPEWVEPILSRGWIARRLADLQEDPFQAQPWLDGALEHAGRALELAGEDATVLELRGTVRLNIWFRQITTDPAERDRLHQGAREDLEAAVDQDPTLTRAWMALNNLYYDLKNPAAAEMAARRAYEEDAYLRNAGDILYDLFWGAMDLEQFIQSRRWCEEGVRRFPSDASIVQCQLWQMATPALPADAELAWQLYGALDSLVPEASREYLMTQWHMVVAGVLARAGLADSARSVLDRVRATVTHESDPTQDLASVEAYMRSILGDYDEAIDLLKLYVAANPEHPFAEAAGTLWWWRDLRAQPRFREITGSGQ